ncbi:amidohydrolase [Allosaccharopolyspora coralli]|uniref:Amidohydrolase n=1 Tax=Allosaccharopolyspora coralli TaxID=2665642 RepID=A0A5Q3Q5J4_9PSEU|nr:amidohydrolase [Allosaccharopolyspora coralli]QGK69090.1 amidohydrolase [Allosaccharopolyspora coralli]
MTDLGESRALSVSDSAAELEAIYVDLHRNPELSFAEHRTARVGAEALRAAGCEVTTGVGRTGVVGVMRNGAGPTVLLRADMDALPVHEQTGLEYASTATGTDPGGNEVPVAHACGHDMHVTWLIGAARALAASRGRWRGTVQFVLQPAEELGDGAAGMIADGLFERFGTPDVAFGQHVGPMPAGEVFTRSGLIMSASDTLRVRMFGHGGHGSRPETTVDPVVMASSTVLRLQTIVSREVAATDSAVLTVGSLHAGTKSNIIPAEAELSIDVRSFDETVRRRVLDAVHRIVHAEATAAGADRKPEITAEGTFPATVNDESTTEAATARFREHFGAQRVFAAPLVTGSEDFGVFASAAGIPSAYWFVGGTDADRFAASAEAGTLDSDLPSNHSPLFAPVPHPTIDTGVATLVVAATGVLTSH